MLDRNAKNFGAVILALFFVVSVQAEAPSAPPAGRSVFDLVFADGIPFPFSKLVEKLRAEADDEGHSYIGVTGVLLPLGRSLQRRAGFPDVFRYPRAVIALNADLRSGFETRDKLFIGYQEKANLLEVISYNERAGRFEFQTVHDYSENLKPRIAYANRKTCLACHQNEAPIFSQPPWDETQANAVVAEKLTAVHGQAYQGLPTRTSQDVPREFDAGVERANRFAVEQQAWSRLCPSDACRAEVLGAILKMRLLGRASIDLAKVKFDFQARWKNAWPKGMPLPDQHIPNRNPLAEADMMEVAGVFEPLHKRAPAGLWFYSEENVQRLFSGLAYFFTKADIAKISAAIKSTAPEAVVAKISATALTPPFRRTIIVAEISRILGFDSGLPREPKLAALQVDPVSPSFVAIKAGQPLAAFRRCAACHDNATGSPPNFLNGDAKTIALNISHCSERIFYRLSMWHAADEVRGITPMPPPGSLEMPLEEWVAGAELKALESYARGLVKGREEEILHARFSNLSRCLP